MNLRESDAHAPPSASAPARPGEVWALCYLDPAAARTRATGTSDATPQERAWSALQAALASALMGDVDAAASALEQARTAFDELGGHAGADTVVASGRRWCDEVEAIVVRRSGRPQDAWTLQRQLDEAALPAVVAPGAPEPESLLRFVAHSARGSTARLLGDLNGALRHQYEADDAASRAGLPGLRLVSLANLGALNQELHNLEDARRFTQQALDYARAARSPHLLGNAAANLIVILNASGEPHEADAVLQLMLAEERDLLPGVQERYGLQLALAELGLGRHEAAMQRLQRLGAPGAPSPGREASHRVFWHWLHCRCRLEAGQPDEAAAGAQAELRTHDEALWRAHPYLAMELLRTAAEALERVGEPTQALVRLRQAQALYEMLVGRGARARYVALEVAWRLRTAQDERDLAVRLQAMAESEHRRLQALNEALEAQIRETQRLHGQLREQALRDALTGLHNRRFLFEAAPEMLNRAAREEAALVVAMLDLDHFKRLNDTHGHDAGDAVLRGFAQVLRDHVRAGDLVCRQGGEEFVFVGYGADAGAAVALLERVLQAWRTTQVQHEGQALPAGSFSAGVALRGRDGDTLEQLLRSADAALYAAKAEGRSRIRLRSA